MHREVQVGVLSVQSVVYPESIVSESIEQHVEPHGSEQCLDRISRFHLILRGRVDRDAHDATLRILPPGFIRTKTAGGHLESRFKIFSDPVHGFISVPKNRVLELIQTPEVQRLRRIRQLGLGHLVFPGAEHTRFGHALGAMALMQDTLSNLAEKGTPISADEHIGALSAALLHDIGHGPFSHTLEHELFSDFQHEQMSRLLIQDLDDRFGGALDLAIAIFDGTYERPFFHQLVSSQLDMDRLDYLRRDSFYTGVVEGQVGIERIIKTLRVHPVDGGAGSQVVAEAKGIYAIENYLISRRLMYWQVYLHKTVLAADHLLRGILNRARQLLMSGADDVRRVASPSLLFFLDRKLSVSSIEDEEVRRAFVRLDDTDVVYSIKAWTQVDDLPLSDLSRRFIDRDFFRVTFLTEHLADSSLLELERRVADLIAAAGLAEAEDAIEIVPYYLGISNTSHSAYEAIEDSITIIDRDNRMRELSEMADMGTISALTRFVEKPYVWAPKSVDVADVLESAV